MNSQCDLSAEPHRLNLVPRQRPSGSSPGALRWPFAVRLRRRAGLSMVDKRLTFWVLAWYRRIAPAKFRGPLFGHLVNAAGLALLVQSQ